MTEEVVRSATHTHSLVRAHSWLKFRYLVENVLAIMLREKYLK